MRKFLPYLVVGILVLSGLGAVGFSIKQPKTTGTLEITASIAFSEHLVIKEKEGYLTVKLEGADSLSTEGDKPMLPVYRTVFMFSRAAKIKGVTCDYSEMKEQGIVGKIIPAPEAIPRRYIETAAMTSMVKENEEVYGSDEMYPGSWYDYTIRCGVDSKGIPTTFVIVEVHPVQYAPAKNMLYYVSDAEIRVLYDDPGVDTLSDGLESYDLVVIAPGEFSELLQPLIEHKNNHGVINTILKTTEEIYSEYDGRDKPEQIKYFIKDAVENWGITYVLLVGGLKSYIYANDKDDCNQGSTDWYLPVRYTNIQHSNEKGVISDLYYGDLYRYNESSEEWEFEDWDSNGDGILARWTMLVGGKDVLDLVPDVYVGRLPCRNTREVKTVVNKIINYEEISPEKSWFKKMIGIAGRTFNIYNEQPDGEFACDTAISYMGDLVDEPLRLYASNKDTGGPLPIPEDILPTISEGAGYVLFQGHGNPVVWNTHWPDRPNEEWVGATKLYDFWRFSNREKLPIVIVGGCHNGLFNVTLIKSLLSTRLNNDHWYWTHGYPAPVCFSWGLCILPRGGAIASTGCTGLGLGGATPLSNSGGLEVNFFYQIGQEGATTLGSAHSGAITQFITENSIKQDQAFCIVEYQLFGDPSLTLGGYS